MPVMRHQAIGKDPGDLTRQKKQRARTQHQVQVKLKAPMIMTGNNHVLSSYELQWLLIPRPPLPRPIVEASYWLTGKYGGHLMLIGWSKYIVHMYNEEKFDEFLFFSWQGQLRDSRDQDQAPLTTHGPCTLVAVFAQQSSKLFLSISPTIEAQNRQTGRADKRSFVWVILANLRSNVRGDGKKAIIKASGSNHLASPDTYAYLGTNLQRINSRFSFKGMQRTFPYTEQHNSRTYNGLSASVKLLKARIGMELQTTNIRTPPRGNSACPTLRFIDQYVQLYVIRQNLSHYVRALYVAIWRASFLLVESQREKIHIFCRLCPTSYMYRKPLQDNAMPNWLYCRDIYLLSCWFEANLTSLHNRVRVQCMASGLRIYSWRSPRRVTVFLFDWGVYRTSYSADVRAAKMMSIHRYVLLDKVNTRSSPFYPRIRSSFLP
ncbi:hypothetical protein ACRALDRAFT_2015749 [Sodiomyces alcalophilus JCM 7366]|uniref:uncharacterized protein n=1 Tax=Sodiomyces alcalophilus JCM 7366 TaxID=591952 RepID=UPI0039B62DE5